MLIFKERKIKSIISFLLIALIVFALPGKVISATPVSGAKYKIAPVCAPEKTLDIQGGSIQNGANCQLYSHNSTLAQVFNIVAVDDGYVFFNLNSGKVLDVDNAIAENGRNVQQYEYNGTNAQKWWIEQNESGTYTIVSKLNPNYVLDISNAGNSDGTNVQIWQRNGSEAQEFMFTFVSL